MPALATAEQVPAESVRHLMAAPASQLDAWQRTIRNAVRGAKRAGAPRFVGFTYLRLVITDDVSCGGAFRYRCDPDGSVWRIGIDD